MATIFSGHSLKGLVIDALFIAAKAAPIGFVLEDRMEKDINGKGFPCARVAGNQPPPTKIISFPVESADRRSHLARFRQRRGKIETERKADQERKIAKPADDRFKEPSGQNRERPKA